MKNILFSLLVCSFFKIAYSQADSTLPVYLRFPTVPQFVIYKAQDSSAFTKKDMMKNKPAVFFIFSPDCDHCQQVTKAMLADIDKFRKTQIIMITHLPYNEMEKFYRDYNIRNYPGITMGRDPSMFFSTFFKLKNFPSVYVYDKKGSFRKSFEGSVAIDKIIEAL